jgi:hypothetical protein
LYRDVGLTNLPPSFDIYEITKMIEREEDSGDFYGNANKSTSIRDVAKAAANELKPSQRKYYNKIMKSLKGQSKYHCFHVKGSAGCGFIHSFMII